MVSIKYFICKASFSVEAKFDVANLPTDKFNNFISKMFLFYKCNLIIENISGNNHVLDIAFGHK